MAGQSTLSKLQRGYWTEIQALSSLDNNNVQDIGLSLVRLLLHLRLCGSQPIF